MNMQSVIKVDGIIREVIGENPNGSLSVKRAGKIEPDTVWVKKGGSKQMTKSYKGRYLTHRVSIG